MGDLFISNIRNNSFFHNTNAPVVINIHLVEKKSTKKLIFQKHYLYWFSINFLLMIYDLFEIRVGALIFNDKKEMLLLLNDKKQWGFLGGHLDKGEQVEDTVHREVKEETNLEVEIIKQFNMRAVHHINSLVIAFACKYKSGEIKLQEEEVSDFRWVKIEELKNYDLTFDELPTIAKEAFDIVSENK